MKIWLKRATFLTLGVFFFTTLLIQQPPSVNALVSEEQRRLWDLGIFLTDTEFSECIVHNSISLGLDETEDPDGGEESDNPEDTPQPEPPTTVAPITEDGWSNTDYRGEKIFSDSDISKIRDLMPYYQKAGEATNIPWQMIAVIHHRETRLGLVNPSNGQGVFQNYGYTWNDGKIYPPGPIDMNEFLRQATFAARHLRENTVPAFKDGLASGDPLSVKDAFFAYNGRAAVYKTQAGSLGFSHGFEGSPYVMNRADQQRDPTVEPTKSNNTWGQIKRDRGPIEYPANRDHGAYVMYAGIGGSGATNNSSCGGSEGGVGIVDGMAFPVKGTQESIKKGVLYGKSYVAWCYKKLSNCHHDYNAADIFADPGTPILAARSGTVVSVNNNGSGKVASKRAYMTIVDDNNDVWFYTHGTPGSAVVTKGQKVEAGQTLMTVGPDSAADFTAPHLHIDMLPGSFANGYRPGCAGQGCSGMPFVELQPSLVKSFQALPSEGMTDPAFNNKGPSAQ